MRTKIITVALVFAFLFSSATGILPVDLTSANPNYMLSLPAITIQSDGTITPDTGLITKNGTTYTMNTDIVSQYIIRIYCSNITFNGARHILNCSFPYYIHGQTLFPSTSDGILLQNVTNVTVKDVEITGTPQGSHYYSVALRECTSCTLSRGKGDNVYIQGGSLNAIVESDFKYILGDYIVPTPTPTPNPTPTPTVPEFSLLAFLPLFATMLFVALFLKHCRIKKPEKRFQFSFFVLACLFCYCPMK